MRQDVLIKLVFFLQPLAAGAWLARIPEIQTALGVGPGTLGLVLLGMPVGTLITLPFGGRIAEAIGAWRLLAFGFPAFLLLVMAAAQVPPLPVMVGVLFCYGVALSLLELGMNIEAGRIESESGRLIMNTCHGFWSVGLATGTFIGAGFAGLHVSPGLAGIILAAGLLVPGMAAIRALPRMATGAPSEPAPLISLPSVPLLAICAYVFGIAMTEGAMADWAGIFLRDAMGTAPEHTGYGFAIFATLVAGGRFVGDGLKARIGAVRLAQLCGVAALAGLGLVAVAPSTPTALVAFGLVGFGASVGFPLSVSAAGALDSARAATNVATLTFFALTSFLVGPPLIGQIAEHAGIRAGLMALLPALIVSLLAARALRPASTGPSTDEKTS